MSMHNDEEYYNDEDYVIRIRPGCDMQANANGRKEAVWTGEIDISIITGPDNPLDDESYSQVMHFVRMMCATVPLMESNKELRNLVHEFVMEELDLEDEEEYDEPSVVVKQEDGNVVRLQFSSKTKGSA
tara:strand:+ start:188 stop:574 length:387 start_codon:yes stop_codon:yes gene_type:complete